MCACFVGFLADPVPPELLMQRGSPQEEEETIQVFQATAEGGPCDAPANIFPFTQDLVKTSSST